MRSSSIPAAALAAGAIIVGAIPAPAAALGSGHRAVAPPMLLPSAQARLRGASAGAGWLVGGPPTPRARKVAAAMGARPLRAPGVYLVARDRARPFASALRARGLLSFAEPDVALSPMSAPDANPAAWARGAVVAPTLVPSAPGAASIAVVDDFVDPTVINLSLGGPVPCFTMQIAVAIAYGEGSLAVAAAGNDAADGDPVVYPAGFPHVLSVGSVGTTLAPSSFSEVDDAIDLAAPGEQVPAALPVAFDTTDGAADGVTVADGTSFAAPMVSGAAAWLSTARPDLSIGQVADMLRFSATDVPPSGWDDRTGFGLVNMARALAEPTPPDDLLEPNDDIAYVDGRVFKGADPLLWRGGSRLILAGASVDAVEDPADVYRVRLPARSAARITLRPAFGRPALRVFSTRARTVYRRRGRIARGGGRATRRATIANPRRRAAVVDIAVLAPTRGTALNAPYRLTVARARQERPAACAAAPPE